MVFQAIVLFCALLFTGCWLEWLILLANGGAEAVPYKSTVLMAAGIAAYYFAMKGM